MAIKAQLKYVFGVPSSIKSRTVVTYNTPSITIVSTAFAKQEDIKIEY